MPFTYEKLFCIFIAAYHAGAKAEVNMDHKCTVMSRNFTAVFFDLETTGHYNRDEIIQIGAITKDKIFCRYMLPTGEITARVAEVTGFTKVGNKLRYRGEVKETTTLKKALEDLLEYLGQFNMPVIMVGQNCLTFDCRFIVKGLKQHGLLDQFARIVQGFTDSLPLLKKYLPGRSSYNQKDLAVDILGPSSNMMAHEALADATTLISIFRKEKVPLSQIFEFARSIKDVLKREDTRITAQNNLLTLGTLRPLIKDSMLRKMAEAGLDLEYLKKCLDAEGPEGLARYLSEILEDGKPRVTLNKRILKDICDAVKQAVRIRQ
nr:PREDICTED: uncharacterized protein LOC109038044 [Bemisia tabaci]